MEKKELRCGYTTGTCSALAAKAAATMLMLDNAIDNVSVCTPNGKVIDVKVLDINIEREADKIISASCAVKKDAGDDPDVTNGILIYAKVSLNSEKGIHIDGGIGIGRVTKPGLSQNIGEAAINPVPKKMIADNVSEVMDEAGYTGGVDVLIYAPLGEEIAKKTFNPRLGIEGGISIIGTTGIVEPMSQKALVDTIKVEMNVAKAEGRKSILIVPGNYGKDFIKSTLGIAVENAVACSNYVGESIDYACELGFENIILIGHTGKFIKLAAGVFNTHSHVADCRMETLAAHYAMAGGNPSIVREIMESVSTDEAIRIIKEAGKFNEVFKSVMDKIEYHLSKRADGIKNIGLITFSNEWGIVGKTSKADDILRCVLKEIDKNKNPLEEADD